MTTVSIPAIPVYNGNTGAQPQSGGVSHADKYVYTDKQTHRHTDTQERMREARDQQWAIRERARVYTCVCARAHTQDAHTQTQKKVRGTVPGARNPVRAV
jgi:hypothetical protein